MTDESRTPGTEIRSRLTVAFAVVCSACMLVIVYYGLFVKPTCRPIDWQALGVGEQFVEIPRGACDWNIPLDGNFRWLKKRIEEVEKVCVSPRQSR